MSNASGLLYIGCPGITMHVLFTSKVMSLDGLFWVLWFYATVEKDAIEERERQEEAAREKKKKEEADQRMKEEEAAGLVGKEESTTDKQLEAHVEEVFVNFYYQHTIISYVFHILCLLNADCDQ